MSVMRNASLVLRERPSYFWKCVTLSDDCLLISAEDPKLFYFVVGVIALYLAFAIIVGGDINFFWSLDKFQQQIDYYLCLVEKKVRQVQRNQKRLMSTQERSEKQLKRSHRSKAVVNALRMSLASDDPQAIKNLTNIVSNASRNSSRIDMTNSASSGSVEDVNL